MIHQCDIARCKHGDSNAPCKYGFPKPCQGQTFFDVATGSTDSVEICWTNDRKPFSFMQLMDD